MGEIKQLSKDLIEKIAAGEVVQNPASVVKELLENALDAGADQIEIVLEEGGKNFISVADNGKGMDKDDAHNCIQRHATSKISTETELNNIRSLGFRGEALASIAAVSKLKITTRTKDNPEGTYLEIEQDIKEDKTIGCNQGTKIEVINLFYNTPARKKYLKSVSTETARILDIVTRYALSYYNVGFKLVNNKRTLLNAPKTDNMLNKVSLIYGADISKDMIEVNFALDNIQIYGYISKPSLTRKSKDYQTLFINDRYVKNGLIAKAVYEAYSSLLFHGAHPFFVLNISLEPDRIDVNVHPSKTIIKISDESVIYKNVYFSVRKTLEQNNLMPSASSNIIEKIKERQVSLVKERKYQIEDYKQKTLEINSETMASTDDKNEELIPNYRILGQIYKTYVLVEGYEGLVLIDQHAAHERILFEKFFEQYQSKNVETQKLLSPLVIEFTPKEFLEFDKYRNDFLDLGFIIEDFGNDSVIVREVPLLFRNFTLEMFKELLFSPSAARSELKDRIQLMIATMACRAAIKAGDSLTEPQMRELLLSMNKPKFAFSCPHGRPTAITLTFDDIEKLFKRKE